MERLIVGFCCLFNLVAITNISSSPSKFDRLYVGSQNVAMMSSAVIAVGKTVELVRGVQARRSGIQNKVPSYTELVKDGCVVTTFSVLTVMFWHMGHQ